MSARTTHPGFIAIVVLLFLRVAIGSHFFSEGLDKIRSGAFDATGFLWSAKGPGQEFFRSMLDDPYGEQLLCISPVPEDQQVTSSTPPVRIDAELTRAIWADFLDRCVGHYRIGDESRISSLIALRKRLAEEITTARRKSDTSVDTSLLERQRAEAEREIRQLRSQLAELKPMLDSHVAELEGWLKMNRDELIEHFSSADRTKGFIRDGEQGQAIVAGVESLRDQAGKIAADRASKVRQWRTDVLAIWDSLEQSVQGLLVPAQASMAPVLLHRPFDQPNSRIKWINTILPWFDLSVGVMLLLGVFPRVAAAAGALFLLSVVATQPPWVPDATPVWYQLVEMMALVVLASGLGSLVPGLGWLFTKPNRPIVTDGQQGWSPAS